ncbi:MAG TPA: ACP S-malonyltransferase [Verrucomicrobiae bacterium]|nr:ACP S-malonyltransferase [Verrucomicrobiae bacterium]
MSKTALLFAGQGAQEIGMGKAFLEESPTAKRLFDGANTLLGYDLARICFYGPDTDLTKTENAQPGIFLVSWVAYELLKERVPTLSVQATAGLSLGEFTALCAAGAMLFEDGLRLVRQRGQFMQDACDQTKGGMAAVIGLDEAAAQEVCKQGGVEVANLNCPGQIVISGAADKLPAAIELAKAKGAKKAIQLQVAGAYHSQLMASALPKLAAALDSVPIVPPRIPVISNVTGYPHGSTDDIRQNLVRQLTSSVRWEASIRYLLAQGFTRFIELGPGTALSGFMKRIDKTVAVFNVSDPASLEITAKAVS